MVGAPGRKIDSVLPIPEAESLPLYRVVLKLAYVCVFVSLCHTNQAVAVTAQQLQVHPRSSADYMT
jgi:hypothetical protein